MFLTFYVVCSTPAKQAKSEADHSPASGVATETSVEAPVEGQDPFAPEEEESYAKPTSNAGGASGFAAQSSAVVHERKDRQVSAPQAEPCANYTLDMEAVTFGMCTCGHDKVSHSQKLESTPSFRTATEPRKPVEQVSLFFCVFLIRSLLQVSPNPDTRNTDAYFLFFRSSTLLSRAIILFST